MQREIKPRPRKRGTTQVVANVLWEHIDPNVVGLWRNVWAACPESTADLNSIACDHIALQELCGIFADTKLLDNFLSMRTLHALCLLDECLNIVEIVVPSSASASTAATTLDNWRSYCKKGLAFARLVITELASSDLDIESKSHWVRCLTQPDCKPVVKLGPCTGASYELIPCYRLDISY